MSALGAGRLLAAAGVLVLAFTPTAAAAYTSPQDWPQPSSEVLARSVIVWDPSDTVIVWDASGSVRAAEQVATEGEQTTITLSTDILFTPDSAALPGLASSRIGDLVSQIPQGATVQVHGHTDSVQGAVDNQQLSTERAEAVAAAVRAERPDLQLEVAGFAATRPAVAENPDDRSTYAANRRVEIVYGG